MQGAISREPKNNSFSVPLIKAQRAANATHFCILRLARRIFFRHAACSLNSFEEYLSTPHQ
jgi:hypothetical protein